MLQRQLMLKQFQELQKHRQFSELADERHQNYLNQQPDTFTSANTSFMPHGTYGSVQGLPNESFSYPQNQRQDLLLTNNFNQYSHLQGPDKSGMQPLFGKPFLGVNQNISNNFFGQINATSSHDFSIIKQEQNATALDPLEQKILFNMDGDDGNWSALMQSAVNESSSDDGGVVQEEWSGLSFQNTELSMDNNNNQSSHIAVVGNQQTNWVDSNATSSLNRGGSQQGQPVIKAFPFQGFQLLNGYAEERNNSAKSHDRMCKPPNVGSSSEPRLQQGSSHNVNQHQKLYQSAASVNTQQPQEKPCIMTNKRPPFDLFIPKDGSQPNFSDDHVGQQQFPILETVPVNSKNTNLQAPQWVVTQERHVQNVYQGNSLYHGSEEKSDKQVPSVSVRDFEAFGRSLKPSSQQHLNYASSSDTKHELGSVSGPGSSLFPNKLALKPSSLPNMQNTAEETGTQGLTFAHTDLNGGDVAFHRTDQTQVNMQKASWFKQYDRTANNSLHPSPLGKQMEIIVDVKTPKVPLNGIKASPSCTLNSDFGDADLSMTRSRKRKTATSDLLPWHDKVTKSFKRVQSISTAEMEWAKAVNRLIDKVDNEVNRTKPLDPSLLVFRPKKRLVLTTQLMQLVFMPAPAAFLRANATSDYDSVAYFSAKRALGDACNLNSWSRNGSGISGTSDDMMTEESKTSEKSTEKLFSTFVQDFTSRAEKLEAYLLRLDKTSSVSNIIVESKELEKFSIMNRFAKFHTQGQKKQAEAATSSGSTSSLLKPSPQRYVGAVRARALPEKTQCVPL